MEEPPAHARVKSPGYRLDQSAGPPFGPPVYASSAGVTSGRIEELLGPRPRFSPAKLAAYFTWPALRRDFLPDCPWDEIGCLRRPPQYPASDSDIHELPARFVQAVRSSIGDRSTVAVAFSGGMDSAAVLHAATRILAPERGKVIAVILWSVDDDGRPSDEVALSVLEVLGSECQAVVIQSNPARWTEPEWSPLGPRFDSTPRLHRGMAETAREHGAEILLHGVGSDQLFQAPLHLARDLLRAGRVVAAGRYLADCRHEGRLVREVMAATAPRIRSPSIAQAYLAASRPELVDGVSEVLTERARRHAQRWLDSFIAGTLRRHIDERTSWSAAHAIDALFPMDPLVPAADLPEVSPFMDRDFALYALNIPLHRRYSEDLATPYFRSKTLPLRLLPATVQKVMPGGRQRGYRSYATYWETVTGDAPRLEALGVVRHDWRERCRDAFDVAMVNACETWIQEAEHRGAIAGELDG